MNKRIYRDIIFLIGLIVVIWVVLKVLLWGFRNALLVIVIGVVLYFLFRSSFFKKK